MKKILALLLALMIASATACGSDNKKDDDSNASNASSEVSSQTSGTSNDTNNDMSDDTSDDTSEEDDVTLPEIKDFANMDPDYTPITENWDAVDNTAEGTYLFFDDNKYSAYAESEIKIGKVETPLNPQEIYANLNYTPEMFQGKYSVSKDKIDAYCTEMDYIPFENPNFYAETITAIPYAIEAGVKCTNHVLSKTALRDAMSFYVMNNKGNMVRLFGFYSVSGNKLTINVLDSWKYDSETQKLSYKISDYTFEYEFKFSGFDLTLSAGGKSVTMKADVSSDNTDYLFNINDSYIKYGEKGFDGIKVFDINSDRGVFLITENDEHCSGAVAEVRDNGLITVTWANKDGTQTFTRQFVFIHCGHEGLILTDGKNIYHYTASWSENVSGDLMGNISIEEREDLEDLTKDEIQSIIETKNSLLKDLAEAYQASGLEVFINEQTGEITFDSAVLFDVGSSEISAEGKAFLKKFIAIYVSVVFGEEYTDFVSAIYVEGHTDTSGDYDMNLQLSQSRADSVLNYCLSDECGMDSATVQAIQNIMVSVGYSYDNPIYDNNGNVDMDASRRVAFRFLINIG